MNHIPQLLPPLDVNPAEYRQGRYGPTPSPSPFSNPENGEGKKAWIRWIVERAKALLFAPVVVGGVGGDVSKWQVAVDWNKAKENGWAFVFVRVLYGLTVDSKFAAHWANSKVSGLKRGVYAYYLDALDPEAQAQKLFDTLAGTGDFGELQVVADIEEINNAVITPSMVKKYLEKLMSLFGAEKVMVYTGKPVWDKWIGNVGWALAYPLWLAQYTLVGWQENHLEKVKNYPPRRRSRG